MYYKTEKDQLVEKLEELISRGLGARFQEGMESSDVEVQKLILARKILLSQDTAVEVKQDTTQDTDVALKKDFVDEFSKVYAFLLSLRGEKDISVVVIGLVEVVIFIFTVVAALSTKAAQRNG